MDIKTESVWLMFGDCLERMKEIPDGSVDMILCDLPYGTTACKWDSIVPFKAMWEQYRRICKGAVVLTSAQPFTTALISSNVSDFRYTWVWIKTNCTGFANAKKQPLRSFEDVVVFYSKQPTYNPQGVIELEKPRVRTKLTGEIMGKTGFKDGYQQTVTNYPKNIIKFSSDKKTRHPTQKPVPLMEYLIKTYTNEGDTVLDNTMGSGTTGAACKNTNRKFIGIEMDPTYYGIACGRIL